MRTFLNKSRSRVTDVRYTRTRAHDLREVLSHAAAVLSAIYSVRVSRVLAKDHACYALLAHPACSAKTPCTPRLPQQMEPSPLTLPLAADRPAPSMHPCITCTCARRACTIRARTATLATMLAMKLTSQRDHVANAAISDELALGVGA